ncbi:MAG: hypothetical protein AB2421_12005, partial [Thermotaleaceae bacterium]
MQGRLLYSGSWKMGLYDGEGTLYHAETGTPLYEGQWTEGLPTGEGIFYQKNGEELPFSLGYLYFEYVLQNSTEDPEEEIKKLLYLENIVELSSMDVQFKKLL